MPFLILALLGVLSGCTETLITPLQTSPSGGHTLVIEQEELRGLKGSRFNLILTFDDVRWRIEDTSRYYGLPYDDSVFAGADWTRLELAPNSGKSPLTLFVPETAMTKEQFQSLVDCYTTGDFNTGQGVNFQVGAVVRGNVEDFTERFYKSEEKFFQVRFNGMTTFEEHRGETVVSGKEGVSNALAGPTLMLGKDSDMTVEELALYKNKAGQAVTDKFEIQVDGEAPGE